MFRLIKASQIVCLVLFTIISFNAGNTREMNTYPEKVILFNEATSSPILVIASPNSKGDCASRELVFLQSREGDLYLETCEDGNCVETDIKELRFMDRKGTADPEFITMGKGNGTHDNGWEPVEGPDDLKYLCKYDEENGECICVPWPY